MIGQTIGQYRIVRKLGEGGMGIVYQAHDQRLDRQVALKFLPHHLLADEIERARFLQEARAASALNHAHVCVVHDLQEHDGRPFIVMEWVDGANLRHKLAEGTIPLESILDWTVQMAEALQEAHAHGIVHRDIKAENVMVNTRGQVKVMDFGLAKLRGSVKLTKTTTTVGTLGYMAPEQILGREVDARSDVFSFGVLFYELLANRLPFHGDIEAALMYSILNDEPAPIETWRAGLSPEYQHLLGRALEKDPADRYQSMADLLIDLRRLKRDSSKVSRRSAPAVNVADSATSSSGPAMPPPVAAARPGGTADASGPSGRRASRLPLVLGIVVLIAAAAGLVWHFASNGPPRINSNATFRQLQVPQSEIGYPGLSADGRWVAYPAKDPEGRWDLFFMNVRGGEVRRITDDSTLDIRYVDVSPDGSQIAYAVRVADGTSEVRVVPSLGGASKTLARRGTAARWTPDGGRIAYITFDGDDLELRSVRTDGGDDRSEYRDTINTARRVRYSFCYSPDGRAIAWLRTFSGGYQELIVHPLGGGAERQLTHDRRNIDEVYWTKQNDIIFSSNRNGNSNLWAIRASGGQPVQVTRGTGPDIGIRVASDGHTLLYLEQQEVSYLWASPLDHADSKPVTREPMRLGTAQLSPDRSTIAASVRDPDPLTGASHIWLISRDGGQRRQVTFGAGTQFSPVWRSDGQLAFGSASPGAPQESVSTYLIDPRNSEPPRWIARGVPIFWNDEHTVLVITGTRSWSATLEDSTLRPTTLLDSTYGARFPGTRMTLFHDDRPRTNGPYIQMDGEAPRLLPRELDAATWVPSRRIALIATSLGRLKRYDLPDTIPRWIPGVFTGLSTGSNLHTGAGDREVIYIERRLASKLVLVENLR